MRILFFILVFLFPAFTLLSQSAPLQGLPPMEDKYGLMRVNNNLLADQTETNVAEWLGYIVSVCDSEIFRSFHINKNLSEANEKYLLNFHYPDSLLPDKNILQTLEWSDLLNDENGYQLIFTACSNFKQSFPINSKYFQNQKWKDHLNYLLALPVTGITYQQAIGFCKWRTKTDSLYYGEWASYCYRLPTLAECHLMNENTDSIPVKDKSGKSFSGFNYCGSSFLTKDSAAGKDFTSVWEFQPTELGLYGIQGNASEMTNVQGLAYGGSYYQYAIESYDGKTQLYDSAQRWLGMRCVAVRFENDTPALSYYYPGNSGLIFGYEGLKTNMAEVGIGFSPDESWSMQKKNYGFIGYSLSFKKSFSSAYWGINNDFWIGDDVAIGLNYNFNYDHGKTNHGFKPFVGISHYNFTLCYGYNFHGKTSIDEINNHQITLRYYLPVIKNKMPPNRIANKNYRVKLSD